MRRTTLKKYAIQAPTTPGIYIFKGKSHKPLYIGKAFNLKNRISQYMKISDIRLKKMLDESKTIEYKKTASDIEALILESRMIKKNLPSFNIAMRDGKQYFFVGFSGDIFSKIFLTHQPREMTGSEHAIQQRKKYYDTSHALPNESFIGPFTDGTALKIALRHLRKIFPYCTCKQKHNNYCLNYHIGRCLGYCCLKEIKNINLKVENGPFDKLKVLSLSKDNVKLRNYEINIKAIKNILSGKKVMLINQLEKEMKELGEKKKFEEAIELQNKIERIKRVFENAKIISNINLRIHTNEAYILSKLKKILRLSVIPKRIEAYDIANIQGKYAVGAMVAFENGKSNKNEYRKFKVRAKNTPNDTAMLREILERRLKHEEWKYPDLILVDGGKAQLSTAQKVILNFKFPIKEIPIIAIAKNERHIGNKIYIAGKKDPIPLSKLPAEVKNLLLTLDSEAHRFAISYHRKLHQKKAGGLIG